MVTLLSEPDFFVSRAKTDKGQVGGLYRHMGVMAQDLVSLNSSLGADIDQRLQFFKQSRIFYVSPTGSSSAAGTQQDPQTPAGMGAILRRKVIPEGVTITVQFLVGSYEGQDPFVDSSGSTALLNLAGLIILGGGRLNILGDPATPDNVLLRGDTSGGMSEDVDSAFRVNAQGSGFLHIEGFKAEYFSNGLVDVPNGTIMGVLEIHSFEVDNCSGGLNFNRSLIEVLDIFDGVIADATNFAIFAQFISGLLSIAAVDISGSGSFFGAAVILDVVDKVQITAGSFDPRQISISNNPAIGLQCLQCPSVRIDAFAVISDSEVVIEDNGGPGIVLSGCGIVELEETSLAGGTGNIVVNRNDTVGLTLEGGLCKLNSTTSDNVSSTDQPIGIQANFGGTIQKIGGSTTITGDPTAEDTNGNGHIG